MLQLYLHEANRVYRDKLIDDKDLKMFDDISIDNAKKFFEVSTINFITRTGEIVSDMLKIGYADSAISDFFQNVIGYAGLFGY